MAINIGPLRFAGAGGEVGGDFGRLGSGLGAEAVGGCVWPSTDGTGAASFCAMLSSTSAKGSDSRLSIMASRGSCATFGYMSITSLYLYSPIGLRVNT